MLTFFAVYPAMYSRAPTSDFVSAEGKEGKSRWMEFALTENRNTIY